MNRDLGNGGALTISGASGRLGPAGPLVAGVLLLIARPAGTVVAQTSPANVLAPAQNARMLALPGGNLLVAEPGAEPNRGTLSLLDSNGGRRTFLGGLPSGLSFVRSSGGTTRLLPDGPDGLALVGNALYIAIGEGDGIRAQGADRPDALVPNPAGVSSPILASVLEIDFSSSTAFNGGERSVPFFLEPASHETLLDGATVPLLGGEPSASASVLTAFRPAIPDADTVYRPSHPNCLAVLENVAPAQGSGGRSVEPVRRLQRSLYVADSGTNRLVRVDVSSGRKTTLVRFPDAPSSQIGAPAAGRLQSVRAFSGGQLLVALSSDSPGAGSVQIVEAATGATQTLIPNLNDVVDAVALETGGHTRLFVLENSAGTGQPRTGRVLLFDVNAPVSRELASGLNDPVSLAIDETNGRLLISSRGDGLILFVPLP